MESEREPFVDVELVHAVCGGHLCWLAFSFFPTKADLIQRGIALLFEDLRVASDDARRWPRACGHCGTALQFEQRSPGGGEGPIILEFDGHTAKHG
jgi:hypothetical protein